MKESIPIHNYCDRWCERCFLTRRCPIYDNVSGLTSSELDQGNRAFWDAVGNQLEEAVSMLKEAARERGIDLENISDEDTEAREARIEKSKNHLASQLSRRYAHKAYEWLKVNSNRIETDLSEEAALNHQRQAASLKNCLEVIAWYEVFIPAKIHRAVSGRYDDSLPDDIDPKDYDGSAKIALIAIDRSLKAWQRLLLLLPEEVDEIIRFTILLNKIRIAVKDEFPNAWNFIRPGFDEG